MDGQRRQPDSYDDFHATHWAPALRGAVRLTGNNTDAEDLRQASFLKVYLRWAKFCAAFVNKGVIKAEYYWLYKIMSNLWLDIRPPRPTVPSLPPDPDRARPEQPFVPEIAEPADVAARRFVLLRIRLARAMLREDPAAWSVSVAGLDYHTDYYDLGKTLAEISRDAGVPLATVNDQIKLVDGALFQLLKADEPVIVDTDIAVGHTIRDLEAAVPANCTAHAVGAFKYAYSWRLTRQWEIARKKVRARPEHLLAPIAKQFNLETSRMLDLLCSVRSHFAYRCEDHYEDIIDEVERFYEYSGRKLTLVNWRMQLLLAGRCHRIPPHGFPAGHRFRRSIL